LASRAGTTIAVQADGAALIRDFCFSPFNSFGVPVGAVGVPAADPLRTLCRTGWLALVRLVRFLVHDPDLPMFQA
jgi:hypothetical protein